LANLDYGGWSTGKFGNAIFFTGQSSYVEAPAVSLGTAATFEAWVYLNGAPTGVASVMNQWSQSIDDEYFVGINPNATLFFAWHTSGSGGYGTTSFNYIEGVTAMPLNTLAHIA